MSEWIKPLMLIISFLCFFMVDVLICLDDKWKRLVGFILVCEERVSELMAPCILSDPQFMFFTSIK